jgi:hypothetical protein
MMISKINAELTSAKAKNPGVEMWRIQYDIEDTGKKVFDNLVFVKASFWKISNWWRALGHEVIPGQPIDTGEPEQHIGCQLRAHLTVEEYNGDQQNSIAYFIEPKPGDPPKIIVPRPVDPEPDNIPF